MSSMEHLAGHLIRRLNQISTSVFTECMKANGFDLTSVQFAALTVIQAHQGIDQASLAAKIVYDKATIGGVVDRLLSKDMIARTPSTRDKRAKALTLTSKGQEVLDQVTPRVEDLQRNILVGLSDTEAQEFIRLAAKVTTAATSN